MIGLLIAISTFSLVVVCYYYNTSILNELELRLKGIEASELYLTRTREEMKDLSDGLEDGNVSDFIRILDDAIVYGEMLENKAICLELYKAKKWSDIIMFTSCGACIGNAIAMFIF